MRRDSIFYQIFQQSPTLLFDLLANPPKNASAYRFDCVAVKEAKFEIDGVFLPPHTDPEGIIYFCEVQFQKDERLYERLFGEAFLYFYRNREGPRPDICLGGGSCYGIARPPDEAGKNMQGTAQPTGIFPGR